MLQEVDRAFADGESFAFETTLSAKGYLRHIVRWRDAGYRVSLFFLGLPSADSAVARVAGRVRQGGHHIPEEVVRRRFFSGRSNFDRHYKEAVDVWVLYDNAGDEPIAIDWGERP